MPQVNGCGGAPHPCVVDGDRWTLARSHTKATDPATGGLARGNSWQILSDNYHQPLSCKGAAMKKALLTLRNHWQGLQIYLRGGVRLIRPIADADPSLNGS